MWYAYIVFGYALPVNRYLRTITEKCEVRMAERKYRHPQVNLRMPEELKEKIARIAEANGRSANAEMVMAIEAWVSYHERKEGVDTTNINMPMTKDEMRMLVDNVKEAVVSQLVGKYDFVPKTKDKS